LKLINLTTLLKRREFSNSAWNIADVVVLPFMMLVVTPYFIDKLGAEQYGVWMLVNSIIVSIGVVNFGIGDATIKFVSKYKTLNSTTDIGRIVNAGFTLALLLLVAVVLLGSSAAVFINLVNPFNLNNSYRNLAVVSVFLGAIVFGLKQLEQLALSLFKGYERYDTSSKISMISKTVLLASQVTVVIAGYHLMEIFIASVIVSFIVVTGEFVVIKKKFRFVSFKPQFTKQTIKEIFSFSTWSWIQSVLGIIAGQVDRFVVITLAGPVFLAYYSLASTIGSQVHTVFTAAVSWVFPKVSAKTERSESVAGLYYKMQLLILLGEVFVISCLFLFGDVLFKAWLGAETYSHSILLIKIFLFYILFTLLSIIPHFTLLGANLIRIATFFMSLTVVLTICFMILGYHFYGVVGVAYGKMVSAMISIPIMLVILHKIAIEKKSFYSGLIIYLPAVCFAAALYFQNLVSVPFAILVVLQLFYIYKKKIKEI